MANTNPPPNPLLPATAKTPQQKQEVQELYFFLLLLWRQNQDLTKRLEALENA